MVRTSACIAAFAATAGLTQGFMSHLPSSPSRTWARPVSAATMEQTDGYTGYTISEVKYSAKPVAETMKAFMEAYSKPVVPAYRTIVNDLITTTHLGVVDKRFQYTPLFAFGVTTIFKEFFKSYPSAGEGFSGQDEVDKIYDAFVASLDFQPADFKADTAAIMESFTGKTEEDIIALFASPDDSALGKTAAAMKASADLPAKDRFLYTRSLGVGLFTIMNAVGVEDISNEDLKKWGEALGMQSLVMMESDLQLFNDSIAKLREMEQLFKEIEIREKKKLASRLEAKANKAAEAAAKAKAEDDPKAEPVNEWKEEPKAEDKASAEV